MDSEEVSYKCKYIMTTNNCVDNEIMEWHQLLEATFDTNLFINFILITNVSNSILCYHLRKKIL